MSATTKQSRSLAKSLHTVTVVANVARYMQYPGAISPESRVMLALEVLDYDATQIDTSGPLFAACVKAVR